jgi:hypothetical protein
VISRGHRHGTQNDIKRRKSATVSAITRKPGGALAHQVDMPNLGIAVTPSERRRRTVTHRRLIGAAALRISRWRPCLKYGWRGDTGG